MTDPRFLFPKQPDDAALWIFAADRSLNDQEQERLLGSISDFLQSWTSHDRVVVAESVLLENRFLVVSAHIPGGDVSGCGIDKLVHAVEANAIGVAANLLPSIDIVYRDESGEIQSTSRSEFRSLVESGKVNSETRVFDTSVATVGQFRSGGLEHSAGSSWHGRIFRLKQPIGV
jgi:hypothetical protein